MVIELSNAERMGLQKRVRSQSDRAEDARKARCNLMLADGETWKKIREAIACNDSYVSRWSKRFEVERPAGLYSRHCGQAAGTLPPRLEARILEASRNPPRDGATHWSTRKLGAKLGVSSMMVARVWNMHGLKPHHPRCHRTWCLQVDSGPEVKTDAMCQALQQGS